MSLPRQLFRRSALALFAALALFVPSALSAEIPASMRDLVMAARHREVSAFELGGVRFECLRPFASIPYIAWRADGATQAPFERNVEAGARWLASAAAVLGHADFELRYTGNWLWRENEVWSYELVRKGIALHDLRVDLHWRPEGFVGLSNGLFGTIATIEEPTPDTPRDAETVYYARLADGRYDVVLARVRREVDELSSTLVLTVGGTIASTVMTPLKVAATAGMMQEYPVPVGVFPDQIDVDSAGNVWFSQPNSNKVTRFDPVTETFQSFTVASTPDGMIIDSQDRLWTGLYATSAGLGRWTIASSSLTNFPPPYAGAHMAIPLVTSQGRIWVTDHQLNRISEFDPTASAWVQSLVMPTAECWVVAGTEDTVNGQLYFTEYSANKLGRTSLAGGSVVDIQTPGGAPAFSAWSQGKVYYSLWSAARTGVYSTSTGSFLDIVHPIANEVGGPIAIAPNGDIVVGTRNLGYILVYHVASASWSSFRIPTAVLANLKDGLCVAPNGVIWFTESTANKIGKLTLQ